MRKSLAWLILILLILAACSPARGACGDGKCSGPENAQNCPKDCAMPPSGQAQESKPAAASGDDLRKSVEITITTDTTGKGYGMSVTTVITLDLSFPAGGGEAALTMGSARVTDYTWEQIPGCEVRIPSDLVGASVPVTFEKIEYYPDGFMILQGPVQYDQSEFSIEMDCNPTGKTTLSDFPFSKTVAVFNEKLTNLSFRPQDSFDNKVTWGQNDAWSTRLVITVK